MQGLHWARPHTPRAQDAGFGYLAGSIVDALRAGRRFAVWRGEGLNGVATPTLATDAGDLAFERAPDQPAGVLHCCGGEHADRETLPRATVEAFDLDGDRLTFGPPDARAVGTEPVPYDTRLEASATAAALGVTLPDLRTQLRRLRGQMETGRIEQGDTIAA